MPGLKTIYDLENYIKRNADPSVNVSNIELLGEAIKELSDAAFVLENLVPYIMELAGHRIWKGILDKIKAEKSNQALLTRLEVACLLANGFFCSFPVKAKGDPSDINFNRLYQKTRSSCTVKKEKIKCLIFYFHIFKFKDPNELVFYSKNVVSTYPNWKMSEKKMSNLTVVPYAFLEDGVGMSQVNFANKRIGGGVLGNGALQEEIRCITSPELIVAKLFFPVMADNEAVIVEGVVQYTKSEGYGDSFRFSKNLFDSDDPASRPQTIVCIDALDFSFTGPLNHQDQYLWKHVKREMIKAYAGFSASRLAIVSGNWGGGCFQGDPLLKAKIQWIAAAESGKNLYYYSPIHLNLYRKLEELEKFWKEATVGEFYTEVLASTYKYRK